jgi:hypothetical protein
MEPIFSLFFLFIAVISALLTYLVMPYIPIMVLIIAAGVALAGGLWWHWTQFATEYRLSTWQEVLRNYASYALLLLAILLSYGFYTFVWVSNGGSITAAISQVRGKFSEGVQRATSQASRSLSSAASALSSSSQL